MNLVTLKPVKDNSLSDFINYWSKQYHYSNNEEYYTSNITKSQFNSREIIELYIWKNGMKLSDLKQKSIENKILSKIEIINKLKKQQTPILEEFLKEFKEVSFVWKIFLLNTIKPTTYPIYDQHIHRAFKYLNKNNNDIQNAKQDEFYFKHYLNFIKKEKIEDIKKLDEAFFAFGQFLNTKHYSTLLE